MSCDQPDDNFFMRQALAEAAAAADRGEVPIGAVAVVGNEIIARAGNRVEECKSVTAHAEIELLRQLEQYFQDWRMEEVTVYVSKEPCAMCAGALVNARVKRLVFGLPDPRSGCCGSALDITGFPGMLWQIPVTGGVLAEEAGEMIKAFFKAVRRREQ
jgi:tRNA(adenine34) deaminase